MKIANRVIKLTEKKISRCKDQNRGCYNQTTKILPLRQSSLGFPMGEVALGIQWKIAVRSGMLVYFYRNRKFGEDK